MSGRNEEILFVFTIWKENAIIHESPITEVKQQRARLVLGLVISVRVTLPTMCSGFRRASHNADSVHPAVMGTWWNES